MRMGTFVLGIGIALLAYDARANIVVTKLSDDIAKTATYQAEIRSADYADYVDETEFFFNCYSGGGVDVGLYTGGRWSGSSVGPAGGVNPILVYELDGGTSTELALEEPHAAEIAALYLGLLRSKTLVMKEKTWTWTIRFNIADFRRKAGPGTPFAKQCGRALGL